MIRCLTTIFFVALAVGGTLAQQKKTIPPPPKPADEGPNLEVTMKFIQDKLNSIGAVNYMWYSHNEVAGSDEVHKYHFEATNVVADSGGCRLIWNASIKTDDGQPGSPPPHSISLKEVADIAVLPLEQQYKKSNAANGHPEFSIRVDPPIYALVVHPLNPADKYWHYFNFYDEDPANRVAKALVHAVELCGGGKKDEPF